MSRDGQNEWSDFFSSNPAPKNFEEAVEKITKFILSHQSMPICLVTSGGTTVPLEANTVRFVDNFSAGTRGSSSAEYLLKSGFAVIFLHRENSLQPFARHFQMSDLLYAMNVTEDGIISLEKDSEVASKLAKNIKLAKKFEENLCQITFTSLSSYLWLLKSASQLLSKTVVNSMLFLAAAVSDFYVPASQLPEHKIQSSAGPPAVQLHLVPKMLKPLVSLWAPNCFVVSFKLETDPNILIMKSRKALETYGHRVVIGNILATRKKHVVLVTRNATEDITMGEKEIGAGKEIEEKIISAVVKLSKV